MSEETQEKIKKVYDGLKELSLYKNKMYGDSALSPQKVFSKTDHNEQLFIRCDDKISRIKNSTKLRKNDVCDLIGYLILICISNEWTEFEDLKD